MALGTKCIYGVNFRIKSFINYLVLITDKIQSEQSSLTLSKSNWLFNSKSFRQTLIGRMSQKPFSKESGEEDLPPPFAKAKDGQKGNNKSVLPIIPLEVGRDDHGPCFGRSSRHGAGGMFIGPDDPVFQDPHPTQPSANPSFLPQYRPNYFAKSIN